MAEVALTIHSNTSYNVFTQMLLFKRLALDLLQLQVIAYGYFQHQFLSVIVGVEGIENGR